MTRRRKHEYRYRDHSAGVTMFSERRFGHLPKIGHPKSVRGYCYKSVYNNRLAVLVRGDKGTARFEGLCWGYQGEGPRGLRHLFQLLRVPKPIAEFIAHETTSPDWSEPRVYWHLEMHDDGRYDVYLYNNEGHPKEHRRFWLECEVNTFPQQLKLAL